MDPVLCDLWIRDPGSGVGENPDPGQMLKILEFFVADPDPGTDVFLSLDPK